MDIPPQPAASPADTDAAAARLWELLSAIRSAKLGAASMYASLAERGPGTDFGLVVRQMAQDELQHADDLAQLLLGREVPTPIRTAIAPGCGLNDEGWPSSLMAVFALD